MILNIQGTSVPALGFGTWQLQGADCKTGVADALSIGYRHIDTAQYYENESEVGAGIKNSKVDRDSIFLTTKVWYTYLQPEKVNKIAEESLQKLQTDYVDLLLIHWPSEDIPVRKTLEAMFKLKDQGKAKHIGVSNFTPALLKEALQFGPLFSNQVEYHPYLSQEKLLKEVRAAQMFLAAYSPLAFGRVSKDPVLQEIGKKYNKTPEQVALRWFLQQENVSVITKAAKPEHRLKSFQIFDFKLDQEDMKRIFQLNRNERFSNPSWAPDWNN